LDADGNVLAEGPAQAQSDWMTADFVNFKITLEFQPPNPPEADKTAAGVLLLKKDNPSGLPQYDEELRVPVRFNFNQP